MKGYRDNARLRASLDQLRAEVRDGAEADPAGVNDLVGFLLSGDAATFRDWDDDGMERVMRLAGLYMADILNGGGRCTVTR